MSEHKWGYLFFGFVFAVMLINIVSWCVKTLLKNDIGIDWANLGIALLLVFAIQDLFSKRSRQANQNHVFFSNLRDTLVIVFGTLTASFIINLPNMLIADRNILISLICGFIGVIIGSAIFYFLGSATLKERCFRW